MGSLGRGYSRAQAGQDASLADRIAALEKNYESLQLQIDQMWRAADDRHDEVKQWIESERHERKAETSDVRSRLTAFGTGGIYLSVMGTVWIVAGTILSTASNEIHCLLNGIVAH
jgi:hypothetical protein